MKAKQSEKNTKKDSKVEPKTEVVKNDEVILPESSKVETPSVLEKEVSRKESSPNNVEDLIGKSESAVVKYCKDNDIENYRVIKGGFYNFDGDSSRLTVKLDKDEKVRKVFFG